jgi:hypothetical protein
MVQYKCPKKCNLCDTRGGPKVRIRGGWACPGCINQGGPQNTVTIVCAANKNRCKNPGVVRQGPGHFYYCADHAPGGPNECPLARKGARAQHQTYVDMNRRRQRQQVQGNSLRGVQLDRTRRNRLRGPPVLLQQLLDSLRSQPGFRHQRTCGTVAESQSRLNC